jgi:hypothetical protein
MSPKWGTPAPAQRAPVFLGPPAGWSGLPASRPPGLPASRPPGLPAGCLVPASLGVGPMIPVSLAVGLLA